MEHTFFVGQHAENFIFEARKKDAFKHCNFVPRGEDNSHITVIIDDNIHRDEQDKIIFYSGFLLQEVLVRHYLGFIGDLFKSGHKI